MYDPNVSRTAGSADQHEPATEGFGRTEPAGELCQKGGWICHLDAPCDIDGRETGWPPTAALNADLGVTISSDRANRAKARSCPLSDKPFQCCLRRYAVA